MRGSPPPPVAGSEKAATHRLGLSHPTVEHHLANARSKVVVETTTQLVWIPSERLPEPAGGTGTDPRLVAGEDHSGGHGFDR
jgi:hypothetical protein